MGFFELEPIFRFMLIGAAGFGAMLVLGSIFYLGIVAPMIRLPLYIALIDLGQSEQAEILNLRRAFSIKQQYVVRYRYRLLQQDGALKSFTRAEKVDPEIFAALNALQQRHEPVPIRYLAEKPGIARLELSIARTAADLAALRTAGPRRRRRSNRLQSYLLILVFVIIAALVNAFHSEINQFLDSLVP